jgi:hypothetical protein
LKIDSADVNDVAKKVDKKTQGIDISKARNNNKQQTIHGRKL